MLMPAPKDPEKYKEWKRNISKTLIGYKQTTEHKNNISNGLTGYKQTKEHARKKSDKNNGMWKEKIPFTCVYCGKIKYVKPSISTTSKYCSLECFHKDLKNTMCGKNLKEKNGKWIDGRAWYQTIHKQIVKLKGLAKTYKCIDCGKEAKHWSNINHLYSLNPDDYQPRCASCHKLYDISLTQCIKI